MGAWADQLLALVRWYEVLPGPRLLCLNSAEIDSEYDVIDAATIRRPMALQPHPDAEMYGQGILVYNHFFCEGMPCAAFCITAGWALP